MKRKEESMPAFLLVVSILSNSKISVGQTRNCNFGSCLARLMQRVGGVAVGTGSVATFFFFFLFSFFVFFFLFFWSGWATVVDDGNLYLNSHPYKCHDTNKYLVPHIRPVMLRPLTNSTKPINSLRQLGQAPRWPKRCFGVPYLTTGRLFYEVSWLYPTPLLASWYQGNSQSMETHHVMYSVRVMTMLWSWVPMPRGAPQTGVYVCPSSIGQRLFRNNSSWLDLTWPDLIRFPLSHPQRLCNFKGRRNLILRI